MKCNDVYGAVVMANPLQEFIGSFNEGRLSVGWPLTFKTKQVATMHIRHRHLLLLLLSPKADTHFTAPHRVKS